MADIKHNHWMYLHVPVVVQHMLRQRLRYGQYPILTEFLISALDHTLYLTQALSPKPKPLALILHMYL